MQLLILRIISLVGIALVYMLFDVFNKRNVPTLFVYGTFVYGFFLTVLYFNFNLILESCGIALAVVGIGYLLYKIGQLGGADVVEFAALSLILPIQISPLILSNANQFGLPFIMSMVVNTGIIALIIVPIYYLPIARRKMKRSFGSVMEHRNIILALSLVAFYLAFIVFATYMVGLSSIGIVILLIMMASSALVMLFSVPITYAMVEYVPVRKFDEGDIIAVNLMGQKELKAWKTKIKGFNRLVTSKTIRELEAKRVKDRFPVYKNAMPFALPIFLALVFSLTIGNLMLLILRI